MYKALLMKENLKGIPFHELEEKLIGWGQPKYRASQLFRWVFQSREYDFEKMTDIGKAFRKELSGRFEFGQVKIKSKNESSDGTIKFLVELEDGSEIESVYIPNEERNTLCISTQAGCKMACTFCATGYMKFGRNLHSWEIVDQFLTVSAEAPTPITNIVLMGMGEPFDNFDEVVRALRIFQDPRGPQIGKRHITVSTVGITPKVEEFVKLNLGKLAISLHGTTEEQRGAIMPINKKYPLTDLLKTCRNLPLKGTTRVTFEYVLIDGINDSDEDAHRLVKLMRGIPNKINLLAYNENPFIKFKRPPEERVLKFQNILLNAGLTATYRRSRGRDITGACGQLCTESKKAKVLSARPSSTMQPSQAL